MILIVRMRMPARAPIYMHFRADQQPRARSGFTSSPGPPKETPRRRPELPGRGAGFEAQVGLKSHGGTMAVLQVSWQVHYVCNVPIKCVKFTYLYASAGYGVGGGAA